MGAGTSPKGHREEGIILRRLLLLAALSMMVMLVLAPAAMGQTRGPSGADGTYNCEDFDDQGQAQEFSLGDPGDTNGLDEDGDGQVCESLPTAMPGGEDGPIFVPGEGESMTQYEAPTDTGTQAVSCEQFISAAGNPSQFQAQQFYDFLATPEQQAALDADGDGFACDDLETGVDNLGVTDADRGANIETPATSTATSTALPATGGISLILPAAVLLLGSGILGIAIVRRNS